MSGRKRRRLLLWCMIGVAVIASGVVLVVKRSGPDTGQDPRTSSNEAVRRVADGAIFDTPPTGRVLWRLVREPSAFASGYVVVMWAVDRSGPACTARHWQQTFDRFNLRRRDDTVFISLGSINSAIVSIASEPFLVTQLFASYQERFELSDEIIPDRFSDCLVVVERDVQE